MASPLLCLSLSLPLSLSVSLASTPQGWRRKTPRPPNLSERSPWMWRFPWIPNPMHSPPGYYDALLSCDSGSSGSPHLDRGPQDSWTPGMSDSCEGRPLKRRGGVVDHHRDVILAHQAHKIHSTPRARRKEWE